MTLILKLAWRNVLRNKRRTLLAVLVLSMGLAGLIFTNAFLIGINKYMINAATDTFLGHGQIHAKRFLDTYQVDNTIKNSGAILKNLSSDPAIKNFTTRTISAGTISSPANIAGISMIGIDPEKEKSISKIDNVILKGTFLSPADENIILIGSRLAEKLEADIGDRVVVSSAQTGTGNLAQEMFRVGGIFRFKINDIDENITFINIRKSKLFLNLGDRIHEIAFRFNDEKISENMAHDFWNIYSTDGNESISWKKIMPDLQMALEWSNAIFYIINSIIFIIVALGIINTLFMSLYERMFEFGILRAIGTRPFTLITMIISEAGMLALLSIVTGCIIAFILTLIFSVYGISFEGIDYGGVTFSEPSYPVISIIQYIKFPVYLLLFSCFAALYPAIHSSRIAPKEAMEKSL